MLSKMIIAGISFCLICLQLSACSTDDESFIQSEIHRVVIESPQQLKALALQPSDLISENYLVNLNALVAQEYEKSRFAFLFVDSRPGVPKSNLTTGNKWILDSIAMNGRFENSCSAIWPGPGETSGIPWMPAPEYPYQKTNRNVGGQCPEFGGPGPDDDENVSDEDPLRGMQCGNIATVHSALFLELIGPQCAFDFGHLNRELVRGLNQFHGEQPGMNAEELTAAHRWLGTDQQGIDCSLSTPIDLVNDKKESIEVKLNILRLLVNNARPPADCTLVMQGDRGANDEYGISHVERVTSMEKIGNGPHYEIQTVNGFDQGGNDATIPAEPGTNTWEFGPNMGRLKEAPKKEKDQMGQVVFEKIRYQCCWVTPP